MPVVLVIGGAGFIGSYLVTALRDRGDSVVILDSQSPDPRRAWIMGDRLPEIVHGEVDDFQSLAHVLRTVRPEAVVNLAVLGDTRASLADPLGTFRTNTQGVVYLLEAVRAYGHVHLVHASSVAVYPRKYYEPIDEEHPVFDPAAGHAQGPYGVSKASAEAWGMAYYSSYGVDWVALRLATVYGFGMCSPTSIKTLVEDTVDGKAVDLPSGSSTMEWIYVRDAVSAIACALAVPSESMAQRTFLVSSGEFVALSDLGAMVRALEPAASIRIQPDPTPFDLELAKNRGRLNCEKARAQLGYRPQFSMAAGLRDYLTMYRAYRQAGGSS